jgi:hypothetical protein
LPVFFGAFERAIRLELRKIDRINATDVEHAQ